MNRLVLVHSACGAKVISELENGSPNLTGPGPHLVFSDAQTDDPVTHCPGCGAPLSEVAKTRELTLELPAGRMLGAVRAPKKRATTRDAAVSLIKKAVRESKQRQAAKAAA